MSGPTPLRALMVDLDGTLARTSEANLAAYGQALQEAGVPVALAELEPRIGGRHWKQFLPEVLLERGSASDPSAIARRKAEIYAAGLPEIELNLGLLHLLAGCRTQLKTALVTSASRTSVEALLAAHGIAALFDAVVTGDEVAHHKPDPEAYRLAAQLLAVTAAETLVYEDSDIGVASARAFGAHVIRVVF